MAAAVIATAVSLGLLLNRPKSKTWQYYIAADVVTWNYQPAGSNQCNGLDFAGKEIPYTANPPAGTGTVYKKVIYRGYTDATFTVRCSSTQWVAGWLLAAGYAYTVFAFCRISALVETMLALCPTVASFHPA